MSVIAIYEPRRLKEVDFLVGFVARVELVEFLLNQLRHCAEGDAHHRLILGQRGMGKTSLLRRLQIGIRDDPELNEKLLPLTFREEQYNVRSLDRFWRNCGEALAEWLETSGDQAAADRLDQDLRGAVWQTPDRAAEAFADRMAATGRRAVLLVDNLDLILNALPERQRWQLRRILQAPGGPILFGAATHIPEQLGDSEEAFYEFFRWDMLEPLTETEMMTCIRRLAMANPATSAPVVAVLEKAPERLRVVHNLTGGNPRILALLYGLLERADGDSVYSDLEGLLDQVTPLYKARVEELRSDLQRAVFDAIALHWDPITAHDLSQATGVEVTGLSPQLARLREFGLIEEVSTSGARAGYQVGERFFNVWYLMRHGTRLTRQRMRWLTGFLETFYSSSELLLLRERMAPRRNHGDWGPLYAAALDAAIERSLRRPELRPDAGIISSPPAIGAVHESTSDPSQLAIAAAKAALLAEDFTAAEAAFNEAIRLAPQDARAWDDLGDLLRDHLNRHAEAEQAYRTAIRLDQSSAWPWHDLGRLLTERLGRHAEAEEAYRTALQIDPDRAVFWNYLGNLLRDHLNRHEEAEETYRTAIRLDPDNAWLWFDLGRILTEHLDRHAEAEDAYRIAIRLGLDEWWTWASLGWLLSEHLGRHSEAEEAVLTAIRKNPNDDRPWIALGLVLAKSPERHQKAEEAYRTAIRLEPNNAWPLQFLGSLLARRPDRAIEAEEAYRAAIRTNPNHVWSWLFLGDLLANHSGRLADAEEAYRTAVRVDPTYAGGWRRLGDMLHYDFAKYTDAEEAYRKAVSLDPKNVEAWGSLGILLTRHLDRHAEAEDAFRTLTRLDPKAPHGWSDLGDVLADHLGRPDDAEEAYRKATELDTDHTWSEFGLVSLYASMNRVDEARGVREAITLPASVSLTLLDATIELAMDNFGRAVALLGNAFEGALDGPAGLLSPTLYRLLRLAERRGFGERLIQWFVDSGYADRFAPVYTAFVALVRGANTLLNVNPEVRAPAESILANLAASRSTLDPKVPPRSRRGRPRRRRE